MSDYNGEERRQDKTNVRLALLERSYFENKDSQIAIHKRVTEFKSEVKEDMRVGFNDLKETIKESAKGCVVCKKEIDGRISGLEAWRNWLTGAYATATIVIGAWLSHHKMIK